MNTNTKKKVVSEQKETAFIYVGPTNKYLSRYAIYKNGYPEHIKQHLEDFPLLKIMFIDSKDFINFEQQVTEVGTVENIQFNEVRKYFKNEVK